MEGAADFQDWEFLHSPGAADASVTLGEIEIGSDDGTITDYFALESQKRRVRNPAFEGNIEELGHANSDDTNWVGPDSSFGYPDQPKMELGFSGIEFSHKDSSGFWPDESSDGRNSLPENEKGENFHDLGLKMEVGSEAIETMHQNSNGFGGIEENRGIEGLDEQPKELVSVEFVGLEGDGSDSSANSEKGEPFQVRGSESSEMEVDIERIEAAHQNSDDLVGIEDSEVSERSDEMPKELGSGESVEMGGDASDSSTEMSNGNVSVGEGDKRRLVWWKFPLELLKFCVFRVRPVWSIPIAATILGVVMLARRLYRMKHKSRRIPLKVNINDKKASQLMVRAPHHNEAVVRHVPFIRSPHLPAGGVTPWPVVALLL